MHPLVPSVAADVVQDLLTGGGGDVDLGSTTVDGLRDAVRHSAKGVEGADLFIALIGHLDGELAVPAAIELVHFADALAMIEIAAWLGRGGFVRQHALQAVGKAFLLRAAGREADYGTRSHALKAAMILAQADRALLRRLQADLLDLDMGDDGEFLRHAARIAGVVLAHEPDDHLLAVLGRLAAVTVAEDEASMELGLDALRRGLAATTPEDALDAFVVARDWFLRAVDASDARPDAELFHRCVDTLVAFQSGETKADLSSRIEAIKSAAFVYTAYLTTSDRTDDSASWLGAKASERVHLSLLAHRLGALDMSFQKPAWLDAAAVIQDELLAVYTASRSLLQRGTDGGVEAVVQPRIIGALQRELHSLKLLDQWIEENSGSSLLPDAAALRKRVAGAREDVIGHRPTEAAAGNSPTAAILEQVPDSARPSAVARVAAGMVRLAGQTTSPIVANLFENVSIELNQNEDYRSHPDSREFFDILVWLTLRFVVMRSDISGSSLPRARYLFERNPAKMPLEKELQSDYHEFLLGSPAADMCQAEARDIGGGRVDILFTLTRTKIVAELKRTTLRLTNPMVVERFGLQKASYDVTNVRFGILMILDLHDLGGGQPHISERVSVHHVKPKWGASTHAIVLFRVQGRRTTPSQA